jgi:hypothetical protein
MSVLLGLNHNLGFLDLLVTILSLFAYLFLTLILHQPGRALCAPWTRDH